MVDPGPASNKPKVEVWKGLAWIGGAGLLVVLAVAQLMILAFGSRIFAERQMERLQQKERGMKHPALPSWLPVYPGDGVVMLPGERPGEAVLHTADLPEKVLDFYAGSLRASGFDVQPRTAEAEGSLFHARRRDGSEATVQASRSESGTWVVLTYKNAG